MEDAVNVTPASAERATAESHAADLLELFYPVHYRTNMALEDAMRGCLSRKQAAILWLIRSAGSEPGRSMRRKEIVLRLQDWFDVSSPAITQALRRMARPPMTLVRLVEDAESAREKRVILTPKGEEFIRTMVERGHVHLRRLTRQLPEDQVSAGIAFLRAAIAAVERVHSNDRRDRTSGRSATRTHPGRSAREPQHA